MIFRACYIMRGLPGSGKSTLGRAIDPHAVICASDDYFVWLGKGTYDFRIAALRTAHLSCQEKVRKLVDLGWPAIVVDNTNLTAWECYPYVSYALRAGYEIQFVEPKTPWAWDIKELAKRNTHNVSLGAITRMFNAFQPSMTVEKVMQVTPFSEPNSPAAADTKAAWEAYKCYASSLATAS